MSKVTKLVLAGLLVAISIVFTQFLAIWVMPSVLRLSFGFVPHILAGWLLGPLFAAVVGVLADVLGMLLFPSGGAYFPGYTLGAALTCATYGLLLYNRPVNKWMLARLAIALFVVHLVMQLGLNTLWISIMTKKAFWLLVPPRILLNITRYPVEIGLMFALMKFMEKPVVLYLRKGVPLGAGKADEVTSSTNSTNSSTNGTAGTTGEL